MKKKLNGKTVFNIVSLLIPIGLIIYLGTSENGFMDLLESAASFNRWWIVAALACHFSNIAIDAYLLFKFTSNYDKNYTFKKALKCTVVGQFFSVITPGAVGGQPMQIYCMNKQKVDTGVSTSALVQKFLVYQTTITVYSGIAWLFNQNICGGNLSSLTKSLAAFGFISHVVVVSSVFMFSFSRKITSRIINFGFNVLSKIKIIKEPEKKVHKIEEQLTKFHESNVLLYQNKKLLAQTTLLTIFQLTFIFAVPYMVYRSFNFSGADIWDMITAQSFVTMVASFMPAPGGSGAAEGSFYVFFAMFFTENTIKSAILVWRIITYFLNIIVFAPFANVGKIKNNKNEMGKIPK